MVLSAPSPKISWSASIETPPAAQSGLEIKSNLVNTLVEWNPNVKHHCERVARLSARIARNLGLPMDQIKEAELAGALHDIGKINLAEGILEKPSRLSDQELALIREIPMHSATIARLLGLSPEVQRAIGQRHERPDGSGYPYGLHGREIILLAKVIAVADTYDSLTHFQPYRGPCSQLEAIGIIRSKILTNFDPYVVDCFTKMSLPPAQTKRSV